MMPRNADSRFSRSVTFNLLGLGLPLLVATVTIPYLLKMLGEERFGILSLVWTFLAYTGLLDLAAGRALTQRVSVLLPEGRVREGAALCWTVFAVLGLTGVLAGVALAVLAPAIATRWLRLPAELALESERAFRVIALAVPVTIGTDAARGLLEAHRKFGVVNAVRVVGGVWTFAGPVFALRLGGDLGMIAAFLAAGKATVLGLLLYSCFRTMPALKTPSLAAPRHLIDLVSFGGWVTVSNVAGMLLGYSDRFLLARFALASLAYYVTPGEIVTKLWLIPAAFTTVYFPEFSAGLAAAQDRVRVHFRECLGSVLLLLFPIVLGIVCLAPEILSFWISSEFAEKSARLMQWLTVGVLINSAAQVYLVLILAKGWGRRAALAELAILPAYLGTLWWAVSHAGLEAVAILWTVRAALELVWLAVIASDIVLARNERRTMLSGLAGIVFIGLGFSAHRPAVRSLVLAVGLMLWLVAALRHGSTRTGSPSAEGPCEGPSLGC
ncbi:MAG: oligosaccharide flippase family protein [Acidobacteriota bacterium]